MALVISDLPYGWAVSVPSTDSSVTSPCPAITSSAAAQLPEAAEVDYQASEDGPFLQEILATGSTQQVAALAASIQKAAGQCSVPSGGAESTHLSAISFPSYGDQSYALQLTASRAGVSYSGDLVVVRKGQVLVEVVVFDVASVPATLVQQMVGTAVGKVAA